MILTNGNKVVDSRVAVHLKLTRAVCCRVIIGKTKRQAALSTQWTFF